MDDWDDWGDLDWRDIPESARDLHHVIGILFDVALQLQTIDHPAAKNVDAIMRRIAQETRLLSNELECIRLSVVPPG